MNWRRWTSDRVPNILARPLGSTIEGILPICKRRNVGAFNWGLVAARRRRTCRGIHGDHPYATSPTPWFHDLLQPDGRPYRADETYKPFGNLVSRARRSRPGTVESCVPRF